MAGTSKKAKSTKKKSGKTKKATNTMKECAKAWNKSDKKGKYTSFVKSFFKKHF